MNNKFNTIERSDAIKRSDAIERSNDIGCIVSNINESVFQKPKYQLNIKIVTNNEKEYNTLYNHYNTFQYYHDGDSGIDLYNLYDICGIQYEVSTINLNIQCEMIDIEKNEYVTYILTQRSSLTKTYFDFVGSGIIDAGYRGNLISKVRCFKDSVLPSGKWFQIISPDCSPIKINLVNTLSSTSRDDSAFGSTGNI